MSSLSMTGISKQLGGQSVLRDVTLTVPSGTRTAVVGASGSGKSTLLRLIAGFDAPDAGRICLGDRVLAGRGAPVPAHRRGVGYVAQDGALFPHLTVEQNILFGLGRTSRSPARLTEVADLVSIDSGLLSRYPHELSGGQQQRVALARALAPRPQVILLDEPFSALDTGLRAATRRSVIDALEHSGVTTILVTHDQEEALLFGEQIAVIMDGRIRQVGQPAAVFDDPQTAEVARFLGDAILLPCEMRDGYAITRLGAHRVEHDHSDRAESTLALVRPARLAVDFSGSGQNAEIIDVQHAGARVLLRVRIDGESDVIDVPLSGVPSTDADRGWSRPGRGVRLTVTGGVVLYPA